MKVKYIGERNSPMSLINGNVYECISIEDGWYRVIDETGEDYLYPSIVFEKIKE